MCYEKKDDKILYIAEILYETGEVHFHYSRKMSDDGIQWIRHGKFTEYHQNGNLISVGFYDEGLESGYWKDYHENGNIAAEGHYKAGREVGKWLYYDECGKLESEEIFE